VYPHPLGLCFAHSAVAVLTLRWLLWCSICAQRQSSSSNVSDEARKLAIAGLVIACVAMASVMAVSVVALKTMKGGSALPDCVQQSHGSFQRMEDMKMNEYNNPISQKETGEAHRHAAPQGSLTLVSPRSAPMYGLPWSALEVRACMAYPGQPWKCAHVWLTLVSPGSARMYGLPWSALEARMYGSFQVVKVPGLGTLPTQAWQGQRHV